LDPALLEAHGAVSEEVAAAMASGVRERLGTDYGIGITGIAGPGGGTPEKPVGLVWIGLVDGERTETVRNQYVGVRETVRRQATQTALAMLRDRLLALSADQRV